jgi:hypothetical protein
LTETKLGGSGHVAEEDPNNRHSYRRGADTLSMANMRARWQPTIHVAETMRIKATIDALDNLVLGSTPDGGLWGQTYERPDVALPTFSGGQRPPESGVNGWQDSVRVKNLWGEWKTPLGLLVFGRTPSNWGMGILANGGECLDCNFGDAVDRVMGVTKLFGTYLALGWDFVHEGPVGYPGAQDSINQPAGQAYDLDQRSTRLVGLSLTPEWVNEYCPNDERYTSGRYLPIAAFTKSGVVDMVNGHFTHKSVAPNAGSTDQAAILQHIYNYIKGLQKGITLPHYGDAKLTFDTRTGFFALDKVVPPIKIPTPVSGAAERTTSYPFLLMSLDTPEGEKRALQYMLIFRSFLPEHFMERYPLVGNRPRAMVFNRYPVLTTLFTELEIPLPPTFSEPLGRAGSLYRKETAKVAKGGSRRARGRSRGRAPPYATLFKSVWLKFRK